MIVAEMRCQICGYSFRLKLLDRENPDERRLQGSPPRCEKCNSTEIEVVRKLHTAVR